MDECLIAHSEAFKPNVLGYLADHFLVTALKLDIEGVTFKV